MRDDTPAPGYLGEFRTHWQPLAAATAGLSAGLSLSAYTNAAMGPQFLAEFGWKRSDFVLTGVIALLTFVFLPVYGRLADVFGVRRIAIIGVIAIPASWIACALMTGPIWQYFLINAAIVALGTTTTPAIYSRIVATRFQNARGLALAIAISGPPLLGLVAAPALDAINRNYGWRVGCVVIAVTIAVIGAVALALIPSDETSGRRAAADRKKDRDFRRIAATPVFWILLIAILLCNLYHTVTTSQLGVMLGDAVASGQGVALLISLFAAAVIVGRFICGLALDWLPEQIVAAVAMALPGVGCLLIASPFNSYAVLVVSVCCLGAAWGAEGDVIAYLVSKRFDVNLYSTVLSLLMSAVGVSSALGAVVLSRMLRETPSFAGFLAVAGVAALTGGALFLLLGRSRMPAPAELG
ncbi:MFS transporter [Mycolicibacterium arenosum]|uniref:MFS transporter n=1 Tax=Mycolicibacterium arenosum TaxID=2952157 RepID=A0ABT1M7R4_9MYCO|nr:MFS transporter [Mycolicibacterium sp. CAU 1645]MCP9275229.1 MFS transporter [Mycolicibacterium sp. CAU 1645]